VTDDVVGRVQAETVWLFCWEETCEMHKRFVLGPGRARVEEAVYLGKALVKPPSTFSGRGFLCLRNRG